MLEGKSRLPFLLLCGGNLCGFFLLKALSLSLLLSSLAILLSLLLGLLVSLFLLSCRHLLWVFLSSVL